MMDIETLSTSSNAIVTTISAVEFDLITGEMGKEFEVALDTKEQLDRGGVLDASTVVWWLNQEEEAILSMLKVPKKSLNSALLSFNDWLNGLECPNKDLKLWGNGVGFDNVIVRNLYRNSGIEFVLPYWCDNDVRTLVTLGNIDTRNFKFEGIKHYGIDDCKHQIKYCHAAYKGM